MLKKKGGATLPGWRDVERTVADILGGVAPEDKDVFDVIVADGGSDLGFSVKCKNLTRATALEDLSNGGRVYMELSNSPAKFDAALSAAGIPPEAWGNADRAAQIGNTVLATVQGWHQAAVASHAEAHPGRTLDLERSVFLTLSYSNPRGNRPLRFQFHSFDLAFPEGIAWGFVNPNGEAANAEGPRCLRGMDPEAPQEALVDLYLKSGGQLKYYPRARKARYRSDAFELEAVPKSESVSAKAARYWPGKWLAAGGTSEYSLSQLVKEMESRAFLIADANARQILAEAQEKLGELM